MDLVERLRFFATQTNVSFPGYLSDAADEIERLRSELVDLHAFADDREARCKRLEAERDAALLRLETAESALERHGYQRSCNAPACNCGDQWNHGGHAAERLREIADELDTNGKTVLQAVKDLVAQLEHCNRIQAPRDH